MLIDVQNLSKKLGGRTIVDDISFSVKKGEILGILGKNGAGKTVLMSMLLGLLVPDEGKVLYLNNDIEKHLLAYKKDINFASSYQSLQVHATVWENLLSFAGWYGVQNPKERVAYLLELLGVDKSKWGRKVFRLSSGEAGRVNIAKALLNTPKVLFLDEPTAFLDPVFKAQLQKLIKDINHNLGSTIIFSSHDMDDIEKLCDKALVIKEGKLSYFGSVEAVSDRVLEYF